VCTYINGSIYLILLLRDMRKREKRDEKGVTKESKEGKLKVK
jgi:hypothetical protein